MGFITDKYGRLSCYYYTYCSLVPKPIPSFSMFHAEKREGLARYNYIYIYVRLHVLDVTNASKIINVGVVKCNAQCGWKFCIAMASSRFDRLYTTKRLQLYDITLLRLIIDIDIFTCQCMANIANNNCH